MVQTRGSGFLGSRIPQEVRKRCYASLSRYLLIFFCKPLVPSFKFRVQGAWSDVVELGIARTLNHKRPRTIQAETVDDLDVAITTSILFLCVDNRLASFLHVSPKHLPICKFSDPYCRERFKNFHGDACGKVVAAMRLNITKPLRG